MSVNKRSLRIRIISKLNGIYLSPLCLSIRISTIVFYLNKREKKTQLFTSDCTKCNRSVYNFKQVCCFFSWPNVFVAWIGFYLKSYSLCSPGCIRLLRKEKNVIIIEIISFFKQIKEKSHCCICRMISDDYDLLISWCKPFFFTCNYISSVFVKCNNINVI